VFNIVNRGRLQYILLIFIPLVLSSYTHLWNLTGFPSIHIDEAHYLRRAMLVLEGMGPQESAADGYPRLYDHPYFGQLFIAGFLGLVGYPGSLNSGSDVYSIQMLHLFPRLLMGFVAIVDTFLLFKIAERRYNITIAFLAAIFFAIMPSTWIFRRVYLDTILIPFLLTSILIALYLKEPKNMNVLQNTKSKYELNQNLLIMLSGIFMGLAIYTKIPVFTMIPLVGTLVFFNSGKSLRGIGIWLIPVIILPMLWPIYSVVVGQTDQWLYWVLWQVERNKPLSSSIINLFYIDPLITLIGAAGFVITIKRRDPFPFLWVLPFLVLSYFIGWVQYFHLTLILPALCISAAIFIDYIRKIITKYSHILSYTPVVFVIIFGFVSTTMLITLDVNSTYYEVYSAIAKKIPDSNQKDSKITLIGSHWWVWDSFWITKYILNEPHQIIDPHLDPKFKTKISTDKVLFVGDPIFIESLTRRLNSDNLRQIRQLYNESNQIASFTDNVTSHTTSNYPYNTLPIMIWNENHPTGKVIIKSNY
jgi:hypothetical protein